MGLRGVGAGLRNQAQANIDARGGERPFPWRKSGLGRADRVIAFLRFLPITKGKLAGTKMRLLPDQERFIREVYGDRRGRHKVRMAIKSEPRGNGKTGLLAGLALCHLLGPESEPRGEVYSAAIDRQQAGILFNEMEAIVLAVDEFATRLNISRFMKRIEVMRGDGDGSLYEALSADARRAHGLAPSLWVYDELAQAKDRELLDNLQTAMGKRKRSLGMIISTQAPTDDHPLSQIIDDGLSGVDPSIVVHLTEAPQDADPFDIKTIRAANPALGRFLDEGDLIAEAERAKRIPAFEPAFRNLRLNQRVNASTDARLVTRDTWERCDGVVDGEALRGRTCYGALDLSSKHDLTSLTLVFPDDAAETGYDVLPLFWTPEDALEARRPRERDLFKEWIRRGHLIGVPGPVVKYRYMATAIGELRQRYNLVAVAYDRWRIDDFKVDMADEGLEDLPLEPWGQGFKDMGVANAYFAELAADARLRHGRHPVLTACMMNAITVVDPAGNVKVDKDKSNKAAMVRVDGAVTLAMALGLAKRYVQAQRLDVFAMIA